MAMHDSARIRPEVGDLSPRTVVPVKWWAGVGGFTFAFIAFVLVRWVTGPYFERVPTGPTPVPTYMKVAITFFQVASIPVGLALLWWFAVRPIIRERRLPLDGMLVIAFSTLWFQDPLSAYGGHWFTYNSWAVNFGSWVNSVPGWLSFGEPGAMLVEPILIMPGLYVYVFVITMTLGSWVMRRASARWPSMGRVGLIACCYGAMVLFDIVLEGIIFMPLGVWEYPGGHLNIFPETYHAYPLSEIITVSSTFTLVACLRYFRNDRGETLAERGSADLRMGVVRSTVMRTFAVLGAVHLALFVTYNVPNYWVGTHSREWTQDLVERSYLTDGLCGAGTDRACPGPGVPLSRNDNSGRGNGSAYFTPDGVGVVPEGNRMPTQHPFRQ